jgi:hypothetical protein
MVKHFIILTSLIIPLFFVGCSSPEPRPTEPLIIEETEAEHTTAEPNETESVETATPEYESGTTEPNETALDEVKPDEAEPTVIQPNFTEPNIVEATFVKPVAKPPVEKKLNESEQRQKEPNDVDTIRKVAFHDKCAGILNNYVDKNGMVDYSTLRRKRLQLKKLLDEFDKLERSEYNRWPKEDRIAFWINAYNIQMLNITVDHYPIEASRILSIFWGPHSIRHIKGIWTDYKFIVMDEEFTLSQIEQQIFSKEFGDPRIFFAASHSSISGPPLRNEPYYGDRLEEQLQEQTRGFLLGPNGFKIDRDKHKVYLSATLQPTWHGKYFTQMYATDKKFKEQVPEVRAVLNFITKYVSAWDVQFLELENYAVEFMKYDWTLNDSSIK